MQPSPIPSADRRRQRVHRAVRELLAEQGFRISMDAVAARAGCSKQTLYSQFGSKQGLMQSVVRERLDLTASSLDLGGEDPRQTLINFALEHLEHLCEPSVVATCQLLSAEAHEFPEDAQTLYRDGCDTLQQRLANWIESAMRNGRLRHDQPHLAAELLLSMIVGLDFERQRFAVPHRARLSARRHWAEYAVDAFLRAFATAEIPAADPAPIPQNN
ncbi:TetR/AcrR family transcriptional regulator [Pseudoxanthomonas wuyuanensis]